MTKELHLFILWEKARGRQTEILNDIKQYLQILECYDVRWSKNKVTENFSRFYGQKLDSIAAKKKHCGGGRFLLITVLDNAPDYRLTETSRGHELVNVNMFALKEKYRKMTGGGHKIHATNSTTETDHDLTLLLGKNSADYLAALPKQRSTEIIMLNRDLTGAGGWQNLEEAFYVLNNTAPYVVLRNYETLPLEFDASKHGDIDILTVNPFNTALLLNAQKVFKEKYRVHYQTTVAGQPVRWDIRFLGDDYYCHAWEKEILDNRRLHKGIYIPDAENAFYSLAYHALYHKNKIAGDYYDKAARLLDDAGLTEDAAAIDVPCPFDAYFALLQKFMREKNYCFSTPRDKSVLHNPVLAEFEKCAAVLRGKFALTDVRPIMINHYGGSQYIYFRASDNGRPLFVKWGGIGDTCKNEFVYADKFYRLNPRNFVRPRFYRCDGAVKFVAMDYVEGVSLEKLLAESKITAEMQKELASQMKDIAATLLEARCVHRDIRPANFIWTTDRRLCLVDNQFTVSADKYRECKTIRDKPYIIGALGSRYALGKFKWDDMYSFGKMLRDLGLARQDDAAAFFAANCGKLRITLRRRKLVLLQKRLWKLLSRLLPRKAWRRAALQKIRA